MEYIPISLGELYDKYSILEIKYQKIKDNAKVEMIKLEMEYLTPFIKKYDLHSELYYELKKTNETLWEIEDSIREKEKKKDFDDEFIALARSVYIKNDERSRIKMKINYFLKSNINEVKSYC
jgi:hypothetical protein